MLCDLGCSLVFSTLLHWGSISFGLGITSPRTATTLIAEIVPTKIEAVLEHVANFKGVARLVSSIELDDFTI